MAASKAENASEVKAKRIAEIEAAIDAGVNGADMALGKPANKSYCLTVTQRAMIRTHMHRHILAYLVKNNML